MTKFHFALAYMTATLVTSKTAREEKGATAVEYGLLVALIAAVIIGVVTLLGTKLGTAFSKITNATF